MDLDCDTAVAFALCVEADRVVVVRFDVSRVLEREAEREAVRFDRRTGFNIIAGGGVLVCARFFGDP